MSSPNKADNLIKAPDESKDPYDVWSRSPTPGNMNTVVRSLNPVINSALTTYSSGNISPLARSKARVMTVQAVKSFDPTRGATLKTHVMSQLRSLHRYSAQASLPMKMSERKLQQLAELNRVEQEFSDTHGRDPSDIELADKLGLSLKRIGKIRAYGTTLVGTEAPLVEGGFEPTTNRPDPMDAWIDYVYYDMNDIDRKVLDWKLGRGGQPILSNTEIARRLRVSPAAVSQRAARIQQKLMQVMETAV